MNFDLDLNSEEEPDTSEILHLDGENHKQARLALYAALNMLEK